MTERTVVIALLLGILLLLPGAAPKKPPSKPTVSVVIIGTDWCPGCRQAQKEADEAKLPALYLNWSALVELMKRNKVPVVMLFRDGRLIKSWIGPPGANTLRGLIPATRGSDG